ncbi:MAG TPA: phenylalanine--tRNA ligase subunit alpha [Terriglobales bacterium]|nr:phenylalanine--tRNA ligase subunit alpha [Terriglobales bacterium]
MRLVLDEEIGQIQTDAEFKIFRDRWLARKNGILTQINELWLKAAPVSAKRDVGQRVNEIRQFVEDRIYNFKSDVNTFASQLQSTSQKLDVTLPGTRRPLGAEHLIIKTMNDVVNVFRAMGYSVGAGPEIETDYYNFESLNFPPNHPARDTQDTLFIAGQESKPQRERLLLRTHTSPVQIRTMERQPPPVRVVIPGKVHRSDTADATHSPVFHQVEGLAVDSDITFCDLKGTLDHAMKALFGSGVKTRFFPSFFPFTEPSADVAVSCFKCGGKGCRICKQGGWIELLGCGMVDPNVFEFVKSNGYDPAKISGFAFGMGVERIAMVMYEIDDIQLFYQGDVRFLEQFA